MALNPAEKAAKEAFDLVVKCIEEHRSFVLEAAAGAGKTFSLVDVLRLVIERYGAGFMRAHKRVGCITYTNVAKDEIEARTDGHTVIHCDTIHGFCWEAIKGFQPQLREELSKTEAWTEKLTEAGGVGSRSVEYQLGYRKVYDDRISLHHDDVIAFFVALMQQGKFRTLLWSRYPILFIDEYQDTNLAFADALKTHVLGKENAPLIGFFGDHWQKIYARVCGKIDHADLCTIGKKANFRSVAAIVDVLNRMRPELPQEVRDPAAPGSVVVYHTNGWKGGQRRTGQHWAGDLPETDAHDSLIMTIEHLKAEGWSFEAERCKILLLTHNALAAEQGYSNLAKVFSYNDYFLKKEFAHIAFLADQLDPACVAFEGRRYGQMFDAIGERTPRIRSLVEKTEWTKDMEALVGLRATGTIGEVVDHLKRTKRPRLPEAVETLEKELERIGDVAPEDESSNVTMLRNLRAVRYGEMMALTKYLDGHTPFSTKHGVKGAEFENVLVVIGRGWNQYNFVQMLEWAGNGIPNGKEETFERNRNLFYVACSRPQTRLAVLFTQEVSGDAMKTILKWFGKESVRSLYV